MYSKDEIINEIKRTARENGGVPLGQKAFRNETGIKSYHWGAYWARFGDAVIEAGFNPSKWKTAYPDELLIKKMIILIRKYRKYPTVGELRLEKNKDDSFPYSAIVKRKQEFVRTIMEFCKNKKNYHDIIKFCSSNLEKLEKKDRFDDSKSNEIIGEVYIFKSGSHYKIGRTHDTVRRGKEIRIQLPEKMILIHSIRTDDPSGVEAYWQNRFKQKRMQGEWFKLNTQDIKAFKRWKSIY